MQFESLSLDDILRREIAIAWNEGVSLMQAICRELPDASSPGARFPLAAEVAISPEGTVSLLRRASGSPGVAAAGQLLGNLLQTDVPVKLRLIHSEAVATTPSFATIKDLSDALAYFERPDAQQLIQELYAKAAAKPARHEELDLVDLEDFLPETPAKAAADGRRPEAPMSLEKPELVPPPLAHAQDAVRPGAPPPAQSKPDRRGQTRLIAVAVVVTFVVVASGAFLTSGREEPAPASDVEAADSPAEATAGAAGEAKNPRAAAVRAPAAKNRTDAKQASQPAPARNSSPSRSNAVSPGAATHAGPDAVATTLTSQATMPDPSWAASLPLLVREPIDRQLTVPAATDANGDFVYSRANREVAPPVAIRPHLPSEPPADYVSDHLMVLDLVVTSKGDVESVRLLTPPKTINDFMIVSAAKAWLFAPAKLNGRPVKYKHRIRFVVP